MVFKCVMCSLSLGGLSSFVDINIIKLEINPNLLHEKQGGGGDAPDTHTIQYLSSKPYI